MRRNYLLEDTIYILVNWVRELLPVFLGIVLLMCGGYLADLQDTKAHDAMMAFIENLEVSEMPHKIPEGINVKKLTEVSYQTYEVEVESGNYTFAGLVSHGKPKTPFNISYEKINAFWSWTVMLDFFGKILILLGISWFVGKRALGIKNIREITMGNYFYYGQY